MPQSPGTQASIFKRMLKSILFITASVYVGSGVLLYALQDRIIYPAPSIPRAALDAAAQRHGITPIDIHASDGTRLYGWHAKRGGKKALIFFHGNGGTVEAVSWFAEQLPDWDVICVAYRGYPGSDGAPSQAGMKRDAHATWDYVTTQAGIPPERVVVHAQSLGGGVAHMLLETVEPKAVVFDSTFLSIEHLAASYGRVYPLSLMLKSPFRSYQRAPKMTRPTLVIHGDADTLIPVSHGREHSALLPDAQYVEVPGKGHGHWLPGDPMVNAAWKRFLDAAIPPE